MRLPPDKALVQTLDFFTPIVNDPYKFGQIAAANSLSDVYAVGGEPLCAMNIVCFPIKKMPKSILAGILRGGLDKIIESGAAMAGGHSVEDDEIKYGLSVSGLVDPERRTSNGGLSAGEVLILTKPIGTGVLSTALKANWDGADEIEDLLYRWASRLNKAGGAVIRDLGVRGATDVTGFGLGGHLLEMAASSGVDIELEAANVPILPKALELAGMGLIPAGSYANRRYCEKRLRIAPGMDNVLIDLIFDAQTSGGLVMGVPESLADEARRRLEAAGDLATVVGRVVGPASHGGSLLIR